MRPILTSLVTSLALLFYVVTAIMVMRARGRYGVKAPATAGDPAFERAYRVHQNTAEQLILFLPALWLFSFFQSPFWAAVLGAVWLIGRILFAWGYLRGAEQRVPGMVITLLSSVTLLVGGLIGILTVLAG